MRCLYRHTKNRGPCYVHAEKEVTYESIDGYKTTIPFSPKWNTLLIQASGGLDSTLLLYLTAKTFKDLNLKVKIQPLSLEIPTKAKNLQSSRAVIAKINELINYEYLLPAIEVIMPLEHSQPPLKNKFFNDTVVRIIDEQDISFEYNGNTLNPPEEARKYFVNDDLREVTRDQRKSIYNASISASPHAFNAKKGIVYLYNHFGIIDELASLTLSCDIEIPEAKRRRLDIPCGDCWWCHERAWGFESNGLGHKNISKEIRHEDL